MEYKLTSQKQIEKYRKYHYWRGFIVASIIWGVGVAILLTQILNAVEKI